ncbi:hypothetical protein LJC40_03060 [Synergistaceae bacterium OttesenSCG-928-D05]|nr:hypothetical protein [Synergistaceae bacterium OttesenSCG-928-D05]
MITLHNARTEESVSLKIRLEIGISEDRRPRYYTDTHRCFRSDMSAEDFLQIAAAFENMYDGVIDKVFIDRHTCEILYERNRPPAKHTRGSAYKDPGIAAARTYLKEIESGRSDPEARKAAEAVRTREKERQAGERHTDMGEDVTLDKRKPLYLQMKELVDYLSQLYAKADEHFREHPQDETLTFKLPDLVIAGYDTFAPAMLVKQFRTTTVHMKPTRALATARDYLLHLVCTLPVLRDAFEGKPDTHIMAFPLGEITIKKEHHDAPHGEAETHTGAPDENTPAEQIEAPSDTANRNERTMHRQETLGGKLRKWWLCIDDETNAPASETCGGDDEDAPPMTLKEYILRFPTLYQKARGFFGKTPAPGVRIFEMPAVKLTKAEAQAQIHRAELTQMLGNPDPDVIRAVSESISDLAASARDFFAKNPKEAFALIPQPNIRLSNPNQQTEPLIHGFDSPPEPHAPDERQRE